MWTMVFGGNPKDVGTIGSVPRGQLQAQPKDQENE
jgi:hypothetical protein